MGLEKASAVGAVDHRDLLTSARFYVKVGVTSIDNLDTTVLFIALFPLVPLPAAHHHFHSISWRRPIHSPKQDRFDGRTAVHIGQGALEVVRLRAMSC
jgi:hypothetical protein